MLARAYREYLLPLFGGFGLMPLFKHDPSVADSDVTPEYLVDHNWLVGSPRTVSEKLADMTGDAGGFGTLLVLTFDFSEEHEAWATSQQMLISEVLPQFRPRAAA
jgi:alkanesulfonate monooxygenase SsuD/methylene tetrahydromethanopterin reductase-like flavin-dependent oxidoreductase (luciferase family)